MNKVKEVAGIFLKCGAGSLRRFVALHVSESAGRFITILVVEPRKYVGRGNFFCRMLNAANTKITESSINISSNSLRMKFDELVQALTQAFEKHKEAGRTSRRPDRAAFSQAVCL